MMEYLMTFGSAHRALKAEEMLKEAGVRFRLLPAPKALEPFCDLVIRVDEMALPGATELLEKQGVKPRSIYRKEGEEYVEL